VRSQAGAAAGVLVMLVSGLCFYGGLLISSWLFAGYVVIAVAVLGLGACGRIGSRRS
jgi:nitroreductase